MNISRTVIISLQLLFSGYRLTRVQESRVQIDLVVSKFEEFFTKKFLKRGQSWFMDGPYLYVRGGTINWLAFCCMGRRPWKSVTPFTTITLKHGEGNMLGRKVVLSGMQGSTKVQALCCCQDVDRPEHKPDETVFLCVKSSHVRVFVFRWRFYFLWNM